MGTEAIPFARQVTLRVTGADPLESKRLRRRLLTILAEQPRALLCDLCGVPHASPDLVEALRAVARHQADWPGTPFGVACVDAEARRSLQKEIRGNRIVVGSSAAEVEQALSAMSPAEHASMTLEPGLKAPRSARAFVARECLRWHARSITGHACLVASEIVTNAVLHAHTPVRLTVSRCSGRLRIAVQDERDDDAAVAARSARELELSGSGRGLLLVSSVCRAWGVYPTADGGKVVWAVLDDPSDPEDAER